MSTAERLPTRDECLDNAAQLYVDGLAEVAAKSPEDAARDAGARTPEQVAVLAARIREQFHPAHAQPA